MLTTWRITKKLKKEKPKPDKERNDLHYYLHQIISYHAQNEMDPMMVLSNLLEDYLNQDELIPTINKKIAEKIVEFAEDFKNNNDQTEKLDFILSVIGLLKNHHQHLDNDELLVVFCAFFSFYELYQFYLPETFKDQLQLVDVRDVYVNSHLKNALDQMQDDSRWTPKKSRNDTSAAKEHGCRLISDLSELIDLNTNPSSTQIVDKLLDCISQQQISKPGLRERACKTLLMLLDQMPLSLCNRVLKKANTMRKSNCPRVRSMACFLHAVFFHSIAEEDRPLIIKYLLTALSDRHLAHYALQSLLVIPEFLDKYPLKLNKNETALSRQLNFVMTRIVPGVYPVGSDLIERPFQKIQEVLRQTPENERNALHSFVSGFYSTYQTSSIHDLLNRYWDWLTPLEQDQIIKGTSKDLEGTHQPMKLKAMQVMEHIGPDLFPEEIQALFYDFLIQCLKDEEVPVLSALPRVIAFLPDKTKSIILEHLLKLLEAPANMLIRLLPLAMLCKDMNEHDQLLVVNKILSLINKNDPDNVIHDKSFPANQALYHVIDMIPKESHEKLLDRLTQNLQDDTLFELSSANLKKLAPYLSVTLKQKTASRIFNLAFASKNGRGAEYARLIQAYIDCFSYEEKVAMLGKVMHFSQLRKEHLFICIYKSLQSDKLMQNLSHIKLEDKKYLPNEIISDIFRFTR